MTSAALWPTAAPRSYFVRPLALWFGAASCLPAVLALRLIFADVPIVGSDLLLFGFALAYFGAYFCSATCVDLAQLWHRNLPWWFVAVLLYAVASLFWSGLDTSNTLGMFYTLCLAGAAFLLPACV